MTDKPDTSAEAVENIANWHAIEGHAWAGTESELGRRHNATAATLRALVTERDAAWQAGWAAGRDAAAAEAIGARSHQGNSLIVLTALWVVAGRVRALPVPPPPHGEVG